MEEKLISDVVKSVLNSMTQKKITLSLAKKLIEKVEAKAKEMGVNAVVAVANEGGNIVAVECMDDSYIASYDIAVNKAFTCASLKMSTSTLKALAQPGCELYGIQFTNNGRIVIFGGGEPLKSGDKTIGGLGVSGGSEKQDTELAEYGKRVFLEELL
jgi:uncharacterized protein GlcG (DUF336 family)